MGGRGRPVDPVTRTEVRSLPKPPPLGASCVCGTPKSPTPAGSGTCSCSGSAADPGVLPDTPHCPGPFQDAHGAWWGAHGHPGMVTPQKPMGISLLSPVAIGRAAPEPAGGFGNDHRGPGTLGPGANIRGGHLLVPSTGPRVVPRLRARVAQSRAAQGQQGQQGRRPAPGCSGSGRGLLTHLEPHKAADCGAAGTGSGLGCLAAPLAPCPHASALAAPRSLNDAQVPPGAALFISLPSPKRDSSLHHLSALCLSAGGSGEKSQGVRNRGLGYRFSNYTFLWSLPKRQQLRLSPSKQRAPSPSGSAESVGRSPPRSPGPLSGKEPRTTPSVSSSGGTHAGGLSFNSFL